VGLEGGLVAHLEGVARAGQGPSPQRLDARALLAVQHQARVALEAHGVWGVGPWEGGRGGDGLAPRQHEPRRQPSGHQPRGQQEHPALGLALARGVVGAGLLDVQAAAQGGRELVGRVGREEALGVLLKRVEAGLERGVLGQGRAQRLGLGVGELAQPQLFEV
jgi:hypothetical protein